MVTQSASTRRKRRRRMILIDLGWILLGNASILVVIGIYRGIFIEPSKLF